jgi:flotillin
MANALGLLLLFAILLIVTPIGLGVTGHDLGAMSSSIMLGSGIFLAIVCAVLLTITKLYVRTKASEAFVRTGMGGLRVIRDGGSLVLPVVHQIVRVSLETIRLDVLRQGVDALITSDKLRADIKAEFFVRVQPEDDSIKAAARSLGDKMSEEYRSSGASYQQSVSQLIEDKLVSALRTAAARKTLEQLNSERDEFLKEVVGLVTNDLTHNGFTLETVTISKLDQTDEANLKANNIFDAQGMRTIAEITQKNLTERNQIVRKGEQERTAQDVITRKNILELERTKAEAEASQASQIAVIRAEQDRVAREKQLEASRSIEVTTVEQQKQVEVARRVQQREVEIAERDKVRAVTEADQKVEVAKRAQQKAVAEAEAQRAMAEAKLADAEAERQKARQQVITVEQIAEAEREKQKAVIAAEAEAGKNYVSAQRTADAEAYKVKTQADARKASADAEAEAVRKQAGAQAEALKLEAEGRKAQAIAQADSQKAKLLAEADGQKAIAMVPIDVKAREVEVEKRRVEEVLQPELEARSRFGEAAQNFELAKIRIEREAMVRVEAAKAMATIYQKVTANVYGTPEDAAKMSAMFAQGMGLAQTLGGFFAAADEATSTVAARAAEGLEKLVQATAERLATDPTGDGSE